MKNQFDVCQFCIYSPPSASDGKPCCMCPATGREITTNADRIRAMSDDELATFMEQFKDCFKDCMVGHGVKDCARLCATANSLLHWLQKPAKKDEESE